MYNVVLYLNYFQIKINTPINYIILIINKFLRTSVRGDVLYFTTCVKYYKYL